jgi:small subunit ribosomal protein S17
MSEQDTDSQDTDSQDTDSKTRYRRRVTGVVISDKMQKTISVQADRRVKHPMYGKYVKRRTLYKAHDEAEQAAVGDVVEIVASRPLSKTKHWRLSKVVRSLGGREIPTGADESTESTE